MVENLPTLLSFDGRAPTNARIIWRLSSYQRYDRLMVELPTLALFRLTDKKSFT